MAGTTQLLKALRGAVATLSTAAAVADRQSVSRALPSAAAGWLRSASSFDMSQPSITATHAPSRSFSSALPALNSAGLAARTPAASSAEPRQLPASCLAPGCLPVSRQGMESNLPATAAITSRAVHSSAVCGAAQTVAEDDVGDEEVMPGDEQLRDMIEPQYVDTQGGRLAYHQVPATGSHFTGVMFCGGLASTMNGTKATMLEMHARRNAHPFVRFDYRGHGASSGEFLDTTLGDWYEDTLAIIDQVALPGPHILVGSSIGGWIALKAAAARRERIRGLVLLAPAVDITELWWEGLTPAEQRDARDTGFVPLGGEYKEGGRVRTSFFDEALDHCLLDTAARDAQVRCPVRILQGANDTIVPPFVANEVVQWLESKDVHLTIVKDGDHRLSRPEDLRSLMLAVEELLALDAARMSSR